MSHHHILNRCLAAGLIACLFACLAPAPAQADSPGNSPPRKIVIIGSSIAWGYGATTRSKSWAGLYADYLKSLNPGNTVINLAVGGYSTPKLMPTGTGREDPYHNITAAIAAHPDAILLSLTSNDAGQKIPLSQTESNFTTIMSAAAAAGIPIWITTTVPVGIGGKPELELQTKTMQWIQQTFPQNSINFWTALANPDGTDNHLYNSGDGVHPNDAGHMRLFHAVAHSGFFESLSVPPVISSVSASSASDTATIIWNTDKPATSTVSYGTTSAYGSAASSPTLTRSHTITLTGLAPGTWYHFRAASADPSGKSATSDDHAFQTSR